MSLGVDCGTFNLVSCKRNAEGNLVYKKEVNAFLEVPTEDPFMFNMMKKAGVPLILREEVNIAYALGEAAIKMAYAMPQAQLKRPMKGGCVNPNEKDAFQIMNIMIHSLLDEVDKDKEILYYTVPANAVNQETDADYHNKILEAIFKAYKSDKGFTVTPRPINEALCLIYAELADKAFTGIGLSCLIPGTKIYTDKGIVEIEKVKPGDKVLTHKGRWKPVNEVITKDFSGISTKLQLQGYTNSTEMYKFVDNHELYVNRDGSWKWIGCEEIVEGDIVGEPIEQFDRKSSNPLMCLYEKVTCSKPVKKSYVISGPINRLIGYFLGDGSVNLTEGCVQLDFADHERNNIEDVKSIFKKSFNKDTTEVEHGLNCTRVKCYSKALANWFKNKCYTDDMKKVYPFKLAQLSRNLCVNLLAGLIRSDGRIHENSLSFYNTNSHLICLIKQLFARLGVACSISWRDPRESTLEDSRVIIGKKLEWTVSTGSSLELDGLLNIVNNIDTHNLFIEKMFIENNFACSRVQKIEHEDYEGTVYDLKVEDDHSFSGPYLTIHNCGAGMVNICFAIFGMPVFSFAIVNSGDWIDKQAAKATGETEVFINKEKTKIDLTKEPTSMIERAIQTQYRIMIDKTVACIKDGIDKNSDKKARVDHPIDFVISGGTSSPNGFENLFSEALKLANLPIQIGNVIKPSDTLLAVSRGALVAAENSN